MSEDHLGKETSVSLDLTESGVTAKAKSRFVAAVDRLCGNAVDVLNIPMERRASKGRALIEGEQQLIAAAVKLGIDRMGHDPAFAERVMENQLGKLFRQQQNKDGVVAAAIEDLRNDPIIPAESQGGTDELDENFLGRFERFAEDATDEQLRQKWGRVLAAETRRPGSISTKVMRVIDEVDASTALLFERLCESKLSNCLPKCLTGPISFGEATALTAAGLIIDPSLGHLRTFLSVDQSSIGSLWLLSLEEFGVAIPKNSPIDFQTNTVGLTSGPQAALVKSLPDVPNLPVYILTTEGNAVAQILPNRRRQALERLIKVIKPLAPGVLPLGHAGTGYSPIIL